MIRLAILLLSAALIGCATAPIAPGPQPGAATVFDDVTVIPMDGSGPLPHQRVVIGGDTIEAIGPVSDTSIPNGARVIDGAGKYLVPGYSDLHVHFPTQAMQRAFGRDIEDERVLFYDEFLYLFLAKGVTRIQIMSGDADTLRLRDEIAAGERLGPKIVVNSPMIDGEEPLWPVGMSHPVGNAEEAEAAVRQYAALGYDRIKVYHGIPEDAYRALIATAAELGMPVDGHSPISVGGIPGALAAGQRLIAHSYDFIARTPPEERNEATMDRLAALWGEYPDTWHTPTLTTSKHTIARATDIEEVLGQPRYAYLHPATVAGLRATAGIDPGEDETREQLIARLREQYRLQSYAVSKLLEEGVTLMTATDVSFPPIVPGFSLHDELRLLVEDAGLTPYQALAATTRTPAAYHGEAGRAGTIAVGKRADLVLLDADPLADIGASDDIAGVMVTGRWLAETEIAARLARIAAYFETHRDSLERYELPQEPISANNAAQNR